MCSLDLLKFRIPMMLKYKISCVLKEMNHHTIASGPPPQSSELYLHHSCVYDDQELELVFPWKVQTKNMCTSFLPLTNPLIFFGPEK